MKKKTIVPLIVFLVGICLLSVFTYNSNVQIQKDRRTIAKLNAVTYGQRIEKDVVENIKRQLPRYMVPNRIVKIDKMPLTVNGKIDRKRLENNEYGKITENFGRITS